MSEIKSYTSHNFNAVNEQIKQISNREKARTTAYWLQSLRSVFLYALVVTLIIVILMLAFSWAYRIINAPYPTEKTEVVRPEIIEKEVLKVVQVPVEKSILESSSSGYKGPTNQPINSSINSTSTARYRKWYNSILWVSASSGIIKANLYAFTITQSLVFK